MINDPGNELAALGDTVAVALDKIYGEPMGLILIAVPAKGGALDATTNMDAHSYVGVLESVLMQHSAGKYDYDETEVTKQ